MPYRINHIHIKAIDPRKTAEWWANTFDFAIVSGRDAPVRRSLRALRHWTRWLL